MVRVADLSGAASGVRKWEWEEGGKWDGKVGSGCGDWRKEGRKEGRRTDEPVWWECDGLVVGHGTVDGTEAEEGLHQCGTGLVVAMEKGKETEGFFRLNVFVGTSEISWVCSSSDMIRYLRVARLARACWAEVHG